MKRLKVILPVLLIILPVFWLLQHYSNRKPVDESRYLTTRCKESPLNKKHSRSAHEFWKYGEGVDSIINEMRALKIPIYADEIITRKSGSNGADELKMAFELIEQSKSGSAIRDLLYNFEKLDNEKFLELLENAEVREVLELAQKAVAKDFIDFGTDYSQGAATLLPEIGSIRNLVKLISINSKALVERGNISEAVEYLNLGIKLNAMANDNVTLISGLVEVACSKVLEENLLTLRSAGADLSQTSDLLTQELNTALNDNLKTFDGERVFFGGWLFDKFLNTSDEKSRQEMYSWFGKEFQSQFEPLTRSDIHGQYEEYLKTMLEMRLLMEEPYYINSEKVQKLSVVKEKFPLINMILPSLTGVYKKYNESQSSMKRSILAIKLDQYEKANGYLPESLSELNVPGDYLIDNITGKEFTFGKKVGVNFIGD